ncbi:MAG: helix-turn-helix domain-containing protein [Candidatus Margulisiibacteriota bacterium]
MNKKLGEFIRVARRKKGLSLVALAAKTNLTFGVMQKIEAGKLKSNPDKDTLFGLSQALEIDYETLVDFLYDHKKYAPKIEGDRFLPCTQVPVLPWDVLPEIAYTQTIPLIRTEETVFANHNGALFGLKIETMEWSPFLLLGDIVVVDLDKTTSGKDTVLLFNPKQNRIDIKILEKKNTETFVKDFHGQMPLILLTPPIEKTIVGKIVQIIRSL